MTWSDAGNLKTDGKGTTFTHDGRNRLKRAVKSDGTTLDFLYTVEGYRIESIRNATGTTPAGLPAGSTRTRFLLSGSEEVADLDANRNITRYFVSGPAIDERVAQIEANGAVTYMHTDRQASVVAITDAAGNVVSRRGFGSYGETDGTQLVGTGSHPFGYTGRRWDPDLGIYYYRARWYDPTTGTFLQTDPIGSLDYINLYAYVGLEPGNATDPSGSQSVKVGTIEIHNRYTGQLISSIDVSVPISVFLLREAIRLGTSAVLNEALTPEGGLATDETGKVHGNLPEQDQIDDDKLEESISELASSIKTRKEEIDKHPKGDPDGSSKERRQDRQRIQHEERVRREERLLEQLRERIRERRNE